MAAGKRGWVWALVLVGALVCSDAMRAQDPAAPTTETPANQTAPTDSSNATIHNSPTDTNPAAPATTEDATDAAKVEPSGTLMHHIAAEVALRLPATWQELDIGTMPPPTAIASYAPPFHLTGILALQNAKQLAILQLAVSTNPLIGHDANWLDTQMHMASGSGMSLLDLIFYYFFPPTSACIEQVLTRDPKATFAPLPATGNGNDSSDAPVLQVSLACRPPATLGGFFESQVSSGITFAQTNDGPRAFANIAKFYLAPMERVSIEEMTWYVFEAQRVDPVGPTAGINFNLPGNVQGAQSDYFWAIGAITPFPFVNDAPRANQSIIHVAYATVGLNGTKRADFMALLQKVRSRSASATR